MNIPQYKSHKTVRALKIADIEFQADDSARIAPFGDWRVFQTEPGFRRRFHGGKAYDGADLGYLVIYADGYQSWSPSKAFEEGYTLQTGDEGAAGSVHQPLPVQSCTPQSDNNLAQVNLNKELEERLLRRIEALRDGVFGNGIDPRWLAIAKTHIEEGFMAMNRAIMQPQRVRLPEDGPVEGEAVQRARPSDEFPAKRELTQGDVQEGDDPAQGDSSAS